MNQKVVNFKTAIENEKLDACISYKLTLEDENPGR